MSALQNFWRALISGFLWGVGFIIFLFLVGMITAVVAILIGLYPEIDLSLISIDKIPAVLYTLLAYSSIFSPIGFMWGLGIAYGNMPTEKTGIFIIWIFAIAIMSTASIAIFLFGLEYFPTVTSTEDVAIIIVAWLVATSLLACIGLGKRSEMIKKLQTDSEEI